jgi:hypothetical protein
VIKKKSNAKKASITLPPELEVELRKRAKSKNRGLSEILQEASRFYLKIKQFEELQEKLSSNARSKGIIDENDVDNLVHKSRK